MRVLLSIAAAAAFLAAPLQSVAASTPVKSVTYRTSYHEIEPRPSAGAYTGRMTLRFDGDGIVSGTYRDDFSGDLHTLTGGMRGNSLWFSIGMRGGRRFNGTVRADGTITGSLTLQRGPAVYQFTAVPGS